MPREQALTARKQRNAALIETMLLAAIADGSVSQREMQTLLRRVIERPEFEGTSADELNALVENSALRLSEATDLQEVLASLRSRLPDHKNRMLAFGLAAAVAFADQRATKLELGLLKTIQAALGISEDEVAQIIDIIEKGGSLSEALGEPLERLYAEVMVLVSAADGKLREAEARALVESLAADPVFQEVSPERAQGFVGEAVAALATEGLPRRLQVLAHGLTTHSQRVKAYRLATKIAHASGQASPAEQRLLELLQATFGLADDEVARLDKGSGA
ncbi:tellurite resistance TerB family protein [Stigmatella sp. ncwal1]|uniref:Tellurite resistance TerB family protein n=1 Tax=Stigmatella ashevillensis TaxID=2995309 RepID=A0ABT5D8U2_9BACT|nr:tellurite resistance TerB family protein [Stigmatella ashevillena]MDC0709986.1 tellurite resistance TerB family protein [Stigmatella ashevillena]